MFFAREWGWQNVISNSWLCNNRCFVYIFMLFILFKVYTVTPSATTLFLIPFYRKLLVRIIYSSSYHTQFFSWTQFRQAFALSVSLKLLTSESPVLTSLLSPHPTWLSSSTWHCHSLLLKTTPLIGLRTPHYTDFHTGCFFSFYTAFNTLITPSFLPQVFI